MKLWRLEFDFKFNILVMRDGLKNLRINSKERDKKPSTKFMTPLKVKVAGVEQRKKILKHVIFLHEMWLAVIDVVLLYDCRSHSVASCLLQEAVVKYIMKNTWTMLILDKRSCGFYSLR